ncbi:MAG: glycoside hydrolase family 43 protein [Oscillospiraceae bacterium]|nr:glycoside hydrolase family 43 protein [Oscillospiraceae bacterium]
MAEMNKPLVTNIFTADPSAHVFDGKIYIYPSHDIPHNLKSDEDGGQYRMEDYHVLRMDSPDAPCVDCGEALHVRDVPWAERMMWAPDCLCKNGKYYFFFPAKDPEGIFRIGVAVGERPEGPFVPQEKPIEGSFSIDPCAFLEDDGRAYLYFGGIWGGQLDKYVSGSYDPSAGRQKKNEIAIGPMFAPLSDDLLSFAATPRPLEVLDPETGKRLIAGDEDRRFFEASWMHKYNGTYYLSWSTGTTHYIVYATADNPAGPFTYRGRVLEPVVGWTTQHSIVEYGGAWYLFYHDAEYSGGIDHRRSVKFTRLSYNEDGTIQTVDVRK